MSCLEIECKTNENVSIADEAQYITFDAVEGAWDLLLRLVVLYSRTDDEPFSTNYAAACLIKRGPLLCVDHSAMEWKDAIVWHNTGAKSLYTYTHIVLDRLSVLMHASKHAAISLSDLKGLLAAIGQRCPDEDNGELSKSLAQTLWLMFEVCSSKTEKNRLTNVLMTSLPKRTARSSRSAVSCAATSVLTMAHQVSSHLHEQPASRSNAQLSKLSARFFSLVPVMDEDLRTREVILHAAKEMVFVCQQCGTSVASVKDWSVLPLPRLNAPGEVLVGCTIGTMRELVNGMNLQRVDDEHRNADARRRRMQRKGTGRRKRGGGALMVGRKETTRPDLAMDAQRRRELDRTQTKRENLVKKAYDALCGAVRAGMARDEQEWASGK